MQKVTLLAKIYSKAQVKKGERVLRSLLQGLKVESRVLEDAYGGWMRIELSGEDENIALKHLAEEIGLCPTSLEDVERFSTMKGYVTTLEKGRDEIFVDIGLVSPSAVYAALPLRYLQAQLVDGRKLAIEKIVELFGFCENLPLTIKVIGIDKERKQVDAALAEKQLSQYRSWQNSLLDRLIILGAPAYDVLSTLKNTGLNRDVISVETLGMFEHALVCKLGTDAAGLIPKIGKVMQNTNFTVFNPKKLWNQQAT
jgi:hypothetical protein